MARLPGFAKLSPTERIEALLKEGLLTWEMCIRDRPGKASKVKIGKKKQAFLASFKLTTHHMMEMKAS